MDLRRATFNLILPFCSVIVLRPPRCLRETSRNIYYSFVHLCRFSSYFMFRLYYAVMWNSLVVYEEASTGKWFGKEQN